MRVAWPLAALAVGIVAGALLMQRLSPQETHEPAQLRPLTFSGQDGEPSASPDGKLVAFSSKRDGTSRIWIKQIGGGEEPLTDGEDRQPRFSPDGSSVLFLRAHGERQSVYRMAIVGGEPRRLVDEAHGADWSPDGQRLVLVRRLAAGGQRSSLRIADLRSGSEVELFVAREVDLEQPRFSPDGRSVAVIMSAVGNSDRNELLVVDIASRKSRAVAPRGYQLGCLAWSGAGAQAVLARAGSVVGDPSGAPGRVFALDLASGRGALALLDPRPVSPGRLVEECRLLRRSLRRPARVRLDPGEHQSQGGRPRCHQPRAGPQPDPGQQPGSPAGVFAGRPAYRAVLEPQREPRPVGDRPAHKGPAPVDRRSCPGLGPRLHAGRPAPALELGSFGQPQIWMAGIDGSGARQVTHDGVDAENATATPDGVWIVYSSAVEGPSISKVRADGSEPTILARGPYQNPEVSPDGRYAAFIEYDRVRSVTTIRFVEVASATLVPFEIPVAYPVGAPADIVWGRVRWMPDGRV